MSDAAQPLAEPVSASSSSEEPRPASASDRVEHRLYDIDAADPHSQLVDRTGVGVDDIEQIGRVMRALSSLREAEQDLARASQDFMRLGSAEMRVLHYLIVAGHADELVTPSRLAAHVGVSAASMSKLLNRLESGGHITRTVHHEDRRALIVEITPHTHASAMATVGHQQAQRFHSAAQLTPAQRDVVIGFLEDMADRLSLRDAAWAAES